MPRMAEKLEFIKGGPAKAFIKTGIGRKAGIKKCYYRNFYKNCLEI